MLEYQNFFPAAAPADVTTTATPTPWINMSEAHKVKFMAIFGASTASAADVVTFTVEVSSTSVSGAESTVKFFYRLSGAINANTWSAPVEAAITGYAPLQTAVDSKLVCIEVDPAATLVYKSDAKWVRATLTAGGTACIVGWIGWTEPRNAQATMISVSS
jgi:hypothetical protein